MSMTKSMDLVLSTGQMAGNITDHGRTESSTAEESTTWFQARKSSENGFRVKE